MPSWERLQNQPSFDPLTDDYLLEDNESGIIGNLGPGGGGGNGPLALHHRALNYVRSHSLGSLWTGIGLVTLVLVLCIVLLSSHGGGTNVVSGGAESSSPFIEPFDSNEDPSTASHTPTAFTPGLQYLYDIFQIVTSNASANVEVPIPIIVAYETGSRASRIFLSHQFFPTFYKLSNYIKPVLVPYGNSSISSDAATGVETLICENGPEECKGNLIHACALRYTEWNDSLSVTRTMMFLECMVNDDGGVGVGSPARGAIDCAKSSGLLWPRVRNCTVDGEGLRLMHSMKNLTDSYTKMGGNTQGGKPVELPIVLFNGHRENSQWSIQGDFTKFLCTKWLKRARECQHPSLH